MAAMDDGRPGETPPGERRLARPPSERYVAPAGGSGPDGAGPRARTGLAVLLAGAGAVVITIAGGLLSITAGLLVIAGAIGWAIAVILSRGTEVAGRPWLAPALASSGVALGQVGLWLVARQAGGTLDPIAYLGETFGVLVPLQLAIAAVVAWWQAR
jgi:hypothetical protein